MSRRIDLSGHRYGRLTVAAFAGNDATGRTTWQCRCECGGEKVVQAGELKRGNTKSCGCLALEQKRQAGKARCHPYSRKEWPRERRAWEGMIRRCTDPDWPQYADYGGRGITVCAEWLTNFSAFAQAMGRAPVGGSIERIDNAQGYSPKNCCWATRKEQANNRRSNRLLTYHGKTQNVSQWAEELGIRRDTLYMRLKHGWPIDRVLHV